MLDTSNLSKFLKGITDAIRTKKGTTEPIEHKLIDEEIASIKSDDIEPYLLCSSISYKYAVIDDDTLIVKLPYEQTDLSLFLFTTIGPKYIEIDCNGNTISSMKYFNRHESSTVSNIKKISLKNADFSQCKDFSYAFAYGYSNSVLEEVDTVFDMTSATDIKDFINIKTIKEVRFATNTLKLSITLIKCSLLSDESIQSIIDGLADLTGQTAQTIYLHINVVNKLTTEQSTQILNKNWSIG